MNIGAYIIICGVGAALMIIGFWIGYVYRATHGPDPLTAEERDQIWAAHIEEHIRHIVAEGSVVPRVCVGPWPPDLREKKVGPITTRSSTTW